jgi:2-phosphosulfolactate phosphatase
MSTEKLKLDICLSPKLIDNYDLTNTTVVIIDIVRASSTICTALYYGVDHIVALSDIEKAKALKEDGYLIAGEREGTQIEGFDYGNSPISIMDRKLEGKKLAMTTTNGTLTIEMVKEAAGKFEGVEIVVGAFVNYTKLRTYLFSNQNNVVLLCSGWKTNVSIEDTVYAGKMAEDLERFGKFNYASDAPNHAIMVYEKAKANLFDFIMDYSTRFKDKISQLGQDIRYCLKEDVAEVLPVLENGKFVNKEITKSQ